MEETSALTMVFYKTNNCYLELKQTVDVFTSVLLAVISAFLSLLCIQVVPVFLILESLFHMENSSWISQAKQGPPCLVLGWKEVLDYYPEADNGKLHLFVSCIEYLMGLP